MTFNFLDLPNELILQIVELIFARDRRHLRLLNKRVDHLISPKLFETVYFKGFDGCTNATLEKLKPLSEYLDAGKELVFSRCTKKLDIYIFGFYCEPPNQHLLWLKILQSWVPTLIHLEYLKWSHWPSDPQMLPVVIDVLNSFGRLQSLRELILRVIDSEPFPGFTLRSFSNLSSVTINWEPSGNISPDFISEIADLLPRCPSLEQFTFSMPEPHTPPQASVFGPFFAGLPLTVCLRLRLLDLTGLRVSADDFRAHSRHFKSLRVLRLMFNRHSDSPEQNDQICRMLLDESIYLDELTIDTTHPPGVLAYLSSYSGLEHLTFRSRYSGADTPESVHRFFTSVLPRHSATLRELCLGSSFVTLWTNNIAPEHLAQFEKCQQLTHLTCSVNLTFNDTNRTDGILRAWLEAAMKLPRLSCLTFDPAYLRQFVPYREHFHDDATAIRQWAVMIRFARFGRERLEKLVAECVVPFKIFVSTLPLEP